MKNLAILFSFISLLFLLQCTQQDITPSETPVFTEEFIEVNGAELYIKRMGEGEPVLVVHGGPVLDHSYMSPFLDSLTSNYELIFFDQRVSGRSSSDVNPGSMRLDTLILDMEAIRRKLSLGKIHLMGHSWGGFLALNYAVTHNEQLRSLILLNPMPPSYELWIEEQNALSKEISKRDSLDREALIKSGQMDSDPASAIQELLKISFRSQFYDSSKTDQLSFYIPEDYSERSRIFSNLMPDITNYDLQGQMSDISVPVLLMYGETEPANEISVPVFRSSLSDVQAVKIPRSGHFPFIENPHAFNEAVLSFLREH